MVFVLSNEFIRKLNKLHLDYENKTNVILNQAPQPYTISRFFGAKDINTRNKQISFIKKWLIILEHDLLLSANTSDSFKYLTALRVLIALCFYIKAQITQTYTMRSSAASILEQLIDEAMGLTNKNIMDEETKACCLQTAKHYLKTLEHGGVSAARFKKSIAKEEWCNFSKFISSQCELLTKKYSGNYPITTIMMPLFAKPFELAGYTTGFIMGDMISKSTKLLPARYVLVATLGSGLYLIMGPTAQLGVILLTPTYAGYLLDTFCGISLAWIMGTALNMVGQGVGFTLGMSLDLSWKLLYQSNSLLAHYYKKTDEPKLSGISLINGECFIEGMSCTLMDETHLPEVLRRCRNSELTGANDVSTESSHLKDDVLNLALHQSPIILEANENNYSITVNGQTETFSWANKEFMVIRKPLKEQGTKTMAL